MEKRYLVMEAAGGTLENETGIENDIVGVYKTKEEAMKKLKIQIEDNKANTDFVLDNEYVETQEHVTMFWNYQENWDCYMNIFIKEIEV